MSVKVRLGVMMFVTYTVWGAWYVTISTYLTRTLHFTGSEAGAVFGTVSIASMISPFFVGLVADRYFATEKVMAVLYGLGAALMYLMTRARTFPEVYGLMLAFCLCYFPTVSLTNSLGFQLVKDPGREFPMIRLMGTFGWIFITNIIGFLKFEDSANQFLVAMAASIVMAVISVALIPHTPPKAKGTEPSLRAALGLDALVMLKQKAYLVFAIASVLACIPITFYYSFANDYFNDVRVQNAAGKMSLGQVSEVVMMLLMPFIFRFMTVRAIVIFGLICWTARYLLLAFGDAGSGVWMFYLAIILHGASYDFFFLTGQLYTDQEAPAHLRNTAQGFILFATFGVGMLAGSLISGGALDYFTHTTAGQTARDWHSFWLSTAAMTAVILLIVAFAFRTRAKIRPREQPAEAAGV
ncbi:MAG TPA: MFS transporter [Bryobacteraceae bacterium]|jgi:nucleoside transporter|nr:MFS transporter [Bryobacteraceae bacterium]